MDVDIDQPATSSPPNQEIDNEEDSNVHLQENDQFAEPGSPIPEINEERNSNAHDNRNQENDQIATPSVTETSNLQASDFLNQEIIPQDLSCTNASSANPVPNPRRKSKPKRKVIQTNPLHSSWFLNWMQRHPPQKTEPDTRSPLFVFSPRFPKEQMMQLKNFVMKWPVLHAYELRFISKIRGQLKERMDDMGIRDLKMGKKSFWVRTVDYFKVARAKHGVVVSNFEHPDIPFRPWRYVKKHASRRYNYYLGEEELETKYQAWSLAVCKFQMMGTPMGEERGHDELYEDFKKNCPLYNPDLLTFQTKRKRMMEEAAEEEEPG